MRVLLICVAIGAVAVTAAFAAHHYFALSAADSIGIAAVVAAVVGAAAALAPLQPKRGHCEVVHTYLELGGQEWITFHFEAHVLNSGTDSEVLKEIHYVFYNRESGLFPVSLIFGARDLNEASGQILPYSLAPGHKYMVEASDNFLADSALGRRLEKEAKERSDYVLRCKFIFAHSRPVTVRVHPHSLDPPDPVQAELDERRLGLN
jgi:hypothetical protein